MNHKLFKALLEYKPSDEQLKSYCSGFAERVKEREKTFAEQSKAMTPDAAWYQRQYDI